MSVEIPAKTKAVSQSESGETFAAGTDVLLLDQVGDEWFSEIVIPDESRPTKKRYVYLMIKHADLDISQ